MKHLSPDEQSRFLADRAARRSQVLEREEKEALRQQHARDAEFIDSLIQFARGWKPPLPYACAAWPPVEFRVESPIRGSGSYASGSMCPF